MLRTKWVLGSATALAVLLAAGAAIARPLSVEIWTDRGDDAVYRPGEAMQVKARSNDDAYLLVYSIDSEGAITVLYPFRRAAGMVEGNRTYRMPSDESGLELTVDNEIGQGYLVAIASRQPFRDLPWYLRPYDPQGETMGYEGRHDEQDGFDDQGRVVGDPTVAIERIRREVLGRPDVSTDFATSYTSYYIGHEVRYPRYVCYDCHRPNHWAWWDGFDPYWTSCSVVDFRVNWNWCWGPCMWSGHTPYYYYVVRSDCPPRFRRWYDNHDRWSSWDGRRRWEDLWGGPLTRYKSGPPVGYNAPPRKGDYPRGTPPGYTPPGYLPATYKTGGSGGRAGVPIGRNRPDWGEKSPGTETRGGGTWRTPGGIAPGAPDRKPDGGDDNRGTPSRRPGYGEDKGGQFDRPNVKEPPRREPSEQPRYERPRGEQPRQEQPRREPARYDPPREQPKQEQPKHEQPRRDPPKQDSPRRDDGGGSGGKHKGGGGR